MIIPGRLSLIFALLAVFAFSFEIRGNGTKMTKEEKADFDIVTVSLADGRTESGKITKYWDRTVGKDINENFEMSTDDGRKLKLNVSEIDSIYFPKRIEGYMKVWRPYVIASPKLGKKDATKLSISGEGERSAHARIVVPSIRVNSGLKQSSWHVFACPCLLLDNDSVAYPFYYAENGGFNLWAMKH